MCVRIAESVGSRREFMYTPPTPTRQNSFVSSASAVCIGLYELLLTSNNWCTAVDVSIEPLSMEYFDELSADLGKDWEQLSEKLLSRAAIQRISQSNARYRSSSERHQRSARETLVQWFRNSARSHNRVRNSTELFHCIQFPIFSFDSVTS